MGAVPAQIERFAHSDRGALRIYLGFFALTLGAGLVLAAAGFLAQAGPSDGLYLKLGGTLVGALGSFPLKECLALRSRVRTLDDLLAMWHDYASMQTPPEAELERVRELVWKLYEKRALA